MKLACWNVNSIKQRIAYVEKLIKEENPDFILLQELKCETDKFPYTEFEELGYNLALIGQKTFNGVAIFSKYPLDEISTKLPSYGLDDQDEQARFVEATVAVGKEYFRIISVYVPNGGEVGGERFPYKMNFLERLKRYIREVNNPDERLVIAGDFNIANLDIDIYDPKALANSICCSQSEKKIFREILAENMFDSFRLLNPHTQNFTWWDYRGGAYDHNKGLRIDYILTNPSATDLLEKAYMLEDYRKLPKTSDHIPIISEFTTG